MLLQTALIVEQVTPDSAAERAGLRPGYRLLSFQGQPLDAPATFLALEENAVHCRNVTIQAEWQGRRQEFVLEPGRSGIETRPNLPEAVFAVYERDAWRFTRNAIRGPPTAGVKRQSIHTT